MRLLWLVATLRRQILADSSLMYEARGAELLQALEGQFSLAITR